MCNTLCCDSYLSCQTHSDVWHWFSEIVSDHIVVYAWRVYYSCVNSQLHLNLTGNTCKGKMFDPN